MAKYPLLLVKINKKSKLIEQRGQLSNLLPIYLIGYAVLSYLNLQCDWIPNAVADIVGRKVPSRKEPTKLVPNLESRL